LDGISQELQPKIEYCNKGSLCFRHSELASGVFDMQNGCCPGQFFRRIGFFALLGFAATFLTGPIIAVISVVISLVLVVISFLLPLVILGLLIGIPLRAFGKGSAITWNDLCVLAVKVRGLAFGLLRHAGIVGGKLHSLGSSLSSTCQSKAHFVGGLFLEVLSGALVGALLGAIPGFPHEFNYIMIACCAAVGALLGIFVGFSQIRLAHNNVSNHLQA
jgi:hypothetical protein